MAVFPNYAPVYPIRKNSSPIVRRTKFGDGYEQRITFGRNQDAKEWTLTFIVKDTDADTIEAFLNARAADAASFDWTPPGAATALKWICFNWTRDFIGFNANQIDVVFQQVFEP